jgi:hypothetical protein
MPNWFAGRADREAVRAPGLPVSTVLAVSVALAVLMSTQYLFQVFIWRHWPWDEVMLGWLEVARDRTVVALAIGTALIIGTRLSPPHPYAASVVLAISIVAGAATGELALLWAGSPGAPDDAAAVAGRIGRWSLVAGSVAVMHHMSRRLRTDHAAAQLAELKCAQLDQQLASAKLSALRVQIEPHFLFNTLATVRRLRQVEPAQGDQLLGHFVAYLGSAQPDSHDNDSTLGQEVALARSYLGVVGARMSGRLQVSFEVPQELSRLPFPPLTLATLVENAVKHGIDPVPAGGRIAISAQIRDGMLEAVVADTGAGFTGTSGSGIGLANIRSRLQTLYGAAAALSLQSNQPSGVRASIRIPAAGVGAAA